MQAFRTLSTALYHLNRVFSSSVSSGVDKLVGPLEILALSAEPKRGCRWCETRLVLTKGITDLQYHLEPQ